MPPPADTPAPAPAGQSRYSDPSERARHASLVRWGKEQPLSFADRLAAIRARRKQAKGKGKAKGAKPKLSKEQRDAQRQAERTQHVASVGRALNDADHPMLSANGLAALSGAGRGEEPPTAMAEGLIRSGMAVRGADGRFRLTSDGRGILGAAEAGDANGVLDKLSALNDKQIAAGAHEKEKAARAAERQQKQTERAQAKQQRDAARLERQKQAAERVKAKAKARKERQSAPERAADVTSERAVVEKPAPKERQAPKEQPTPAAQRTPEAVREDTVNRAKELADGEAAGAAAARAARRKSRRHQRRRMSTIVRNEGT